MSLRDDQRSVFDGMEPGVDSFNNVDVAANVSIAISLKRLADVIAGDASRMGVVDVLLDIVNGRHG